MEGIRKKYFWATIDRIGVILLAFLFNLIMARWFLTPKEFGMIGMLQIFISIGASSVVGGFGQALVQTKKLTKNDINTVFAFNISVALILYIILYLFAPSIANFYTEPELTKIVRWLSLVLVINAFFIIQYNIVLRKAELKKLCIITISSTILGYVIGIICAVNGAKVWSLIISTLSISTFQVIFLWSSTSTYPIFRFTMASFRKLIPFSGYIYLATLVEQIYIHGVSMILGKQFSATMLGYYTQANKLQAVPVAALQEISYQVLYPDFSKNNDNKVLLKTKYLQNLSIITILSTIAFSILFIIAKPIIILLFTDKWLPSVNILRLMCPTAITLILSSVPNILIKSLGFARYNFFLILIERTLAIMLILFFSLISLEMILYGLIVINAFSFILNISCLSRLFCVSIKEQLLVTFPIIIIQLFITFIVEYFIFHLKFIPIIIHLLLGIIVPILLFILIGYMFGLVNIGLIYKKITKR